MTHEGREEYRDANPALNQSQPYSAQPASSRKGLPILAATFLHLHSHRGNISQRDDVEGRATPASSRRRPVSSVLFGNRREKIVEQEDVTAQFEDADDDLVTPKVTPTSSPSVANNADLTHRNPSVSCTPATSLFDIEAADERESDANAPSPSLKNRVLLSLLKGKADLALSRNKLNKPSTISEGFCNPNDVQCESNDDNGAVHTGNTKENSTLLDKRASENSTPICVASTAKVAEEDNDDVTFLDTTFDGTNRVAVAERGNENFSSDDQRPAVVADESTIEKEAPMDVSARIFNIPGKKQLPIQKSPLLSTQEQKAAEKSHDTPSDPPKPLPMPVVEAKKASLESSSPWGAVEASRDRAREMSPTSLSSTGVKPRVSTLASLITRGPSTFLGSGSAGVLKSPVYQKEQSAQVTTSISFDGDDESSSSGDRSSSVGNDNDGPDDDGVNRKISHLYDPFVAYEGKARRNAQLSPLDRLRKRTRGRWARRKLS
jgi:hypothetical protein